jgi:hypothetical protein
VTPDTATFPLPLEINALSLVKLLLTIVVAAPVIASCLFFNAAIRASCAASLFSNSVNLFTIVL